MPEICRNIHTLSSDSEMTPLSLLSQVGRDIMVVRKDHLGKVVQQRLGLAHMPDVSERLEASLAETAVAVLNGASIVRTHDVLPTVQLVAVLDAIKND